MFNVICDSILSGTINMVDTSNNFRYKKSERTVGAAIRYLMKEKYVQREEMIIASKGGFIAEDADLGITQTTILKNLLANNTISSPSEVYQLNCIEPAFINQQFEDTLDNIGLKTLDFYSLNLPEIHLTRLNRPDFYRRLIVNLLGLFRDT